MKYEPFKVCSCGKEFIDIPADIKIVNEGDAMDGLYWDCPACHSCNFMNKATIAKKMPLLDAVMQQCGKAT